MRFDHWNEDRKPVSLLTLLWGLAVAAVLGLITIIIATKSLWHGVEAAKWLIAYLWTAALLGSWGTWWFVEFNRYVFSHRSFLVAKWCRKLCACRSTPAFFAQM